MAAYNGDTEETLENFRRLWATELSTAREQSNETQRNPKYSHPSHVEKVPESLNVGSNSVKHDDKEKEATNMYLCGVRHEETGDVVQAVKFYKRALHLVPNIEDKIYSKAKVKGSTCTVQNSKHEETGEDSFGRNNNEDSVTNDTSVDLSEKFKNTLKDERRFCLPADEPKGTHISLLPREIVIYLFKWVVSSDLDLISLEQLSMVCRGFYLCARDNELWKLACQRMWKTSCVPKTLGFSSYRDMFIFRPRLQFNGCYISKTSYVRQGENSFQDSNYQPWHMVNYFRYLRFYSDGTAVMSTTADMPASVVGKRLNKKDTSCSLGTYTLQGSNITCIFTHKRTPDRPIHTRTRRRNEDINNNGNTLLEQIFQLDLEIKTVKKRLSGALFWNRYTVQSVYQNKESLLTAFDVQPTRFPPLWFSRVKSYNAQSWKSL